MSTRARRQNRKSTAVIAVALLAAATLTGCAASLTYEEAEASQHRVVQTNTDRAFGEARTWAYIGPSGQEVALTEDCSSGALFEQKCFGSPDGSFQFRHSTDKYGSVISESITIRGERHEADCATYGWSSDYVCGLLPAE